MIETPQAQVPAETDPVIEQQAAPAPARFDTLPLDAKLIRAVADQGYAFMTPIQAKAIPLVLEGRDVMGAAQTGTGKTAAFSIPLLQKMMRHETASVSPARHPVRALVLAPTRELADQVAQNIKAYAKHSNLRVAVVFGGIDMKPQTLELKAGVEVLVATPGRLLDHIEAKNCVLNQVEYVVLDEADRMLDIGFLPDLQRILSYLPKQRQTLLFSATFSPEIKRLAEQLPAEPAPRSRWRAPNATATNVEQRFFSVADRRQAATPCCQLLKERGDHPSADLRQLEARLPRGWRVRSSATACAPTALAWRQIAGRAAEGARRRSRRAVRSTSSCATDVAARGLDIVDLPAVFNFDVPFNAEDYVHRIGRTGRAGASGLAITLVSRDDARNWSPTSRSSSTRRSSSSRSRSRTIARAVRRAASSTTSRAARPRPSSSARRWPRARRPRRRTATRSSIGRTRRAAIPATPRPNGKRPRRPRPSAAPRSRPTSGRSARSPRCWAAVRRPEAPDTPFGPRNRPAAQLAAGFFSFHGYHDCLAAIR